MEQVLLWPVVSYGAYCLTGADVYLAYCLWAYCPWSIDSLEGHYSWVSYMHFILGHDVFGHNIVPGACHFWGHMISLGVSSWGHILSWAHCSCGLSFLQSTYFVPNFWKGSKFGLFCKISLNLVWICPESLISTVFDGWGGLKSGLLIGFWALPSIFTK